MKTSLDFRSASDWLAGLLILGAALLLILASGCAETGQIKVHRHAQGPDRLIVESVEVRQPTNAVSPATLQFLPEALGLDDDAQAMGSVRHQAALTLSTGAAQPMDQALAQLGWFPFIGLALCAVGGMLLAAKTWFPLIPMELGLCLLLIGLSAIVLPMLLDRYLWVMLLLGVGVLGVTVWRLNRLERDTRDEPDTGAPPTAAG